MYFSSSNPNHEVELRRQLERTSSPMEAENLLREVSRSHQGRRVVNQVIGAQAYASGNSVVVVSPPKLQLAAHELSHTLQQRD